MPSKLEIATADGYRQTFRWIEVIVKKNGYPLTILFELLKPTLERANEFLYNPYSGFRHPERIEIKELKFQEADRP